jgi:hypothetical protein
MITANTEIRFPWTITPIDLCGDYTEELEQFIANPPEGIIIEEGDMAEDAIGGEVRSMEVLEQLLNIQYPAKHHVIEFTCPQEDGDLNLEFSHAEGDTVYWEQ